MMTTKNTDILQAERETLVRALVNRLLHRGYEDLRVSRLEEFEGRRPSIIFWADTDIGFMPDASAVKDGAPFIFQVETADTLAGDPAGRQIELFSAYARHYRRHYSLVVPDSAADDALRILGEHLIDERFVHLVRV